MEKIGFGGGCHWCTEAVFQTIKGVGLVEQGYISSIKPYTVFSEAVIVHFDPMVIQIATLIRIHVQTHSSTSVHKLRGKYRSAIYTFKKTQKIKADKILGTLRGDLSHEIITEILPFRDFKPSIADYRNYYIKDPNKPFCRTYISPKLTFLKKQYSKELK